MNDFQEMKIFVCQDLQGSGLSKRISTYHIWIFIQTILNFGELEFIKITYQERSISRLVSLFRFGFPEPL